MVEDIVIMINISHLPPLATLHELLRLLNIKACGQLSQNFLLQPWSIQGLVKCAGNLTDANVLEVGPGPGGLTRCILQQKPYHLSVVEIDRRFLIGLNQLKKAAETVNTKMDIYNQDILKFNYDNVFPSVGESVHADQAWNSADVGGNEAENRRVHIIGNLPFHISTVLLGQWLHDISERRGLWRYSRVPMTLTFQEEVAYRMNADVFDPERSRLSILCQSLCELKRGKIIPGSAFLPKAKVDCAVVHMIPRPEPLIPVPFPYVSKLVKAVFQFKTKMLVNGLESLFPPDMCDCVIKMFAVTGVDPAKYPIEVTMDEFRQLAIEYYIICQHNQAVFPYDFRNPKNKISYHERKTYQRLVLDGATLNSTTVKLAVEKAHQDLRGSI